MGEYPASLADEQPRHSRCIGAVNCEVTVPQALLDAAPTRTERLGRESATRKGGGSTLFRTAGSRSFDSAPASTVPDAVLSVRPPLCGTNP